MSEALLVMTGCGADHGCMCSTCCLLFPKTIHNDAIERKRSGSRSEVSRALKHVRLTKISDLRMCTQVFRLI